RTRLYVSNQASDTVSVFDISTLTPVTMHAPVAVGNSPNSLAVLPDGSAVYVASTGTNSVTLINGNSFLTQQIAASDAAGATVTSVGTSVAGSKVYATVVEPTNTKNGTAIIRVTDNVLVTTIGAPQQDLTCKPSSTVTCPLMRPAQVATRQQQ
ncbi:MAG TPA: beta-propeller fold lactonase family protein, partial [Terriglobales bacterium]